MRVFLRSRYYCLSALSLFVAGCTQSVNTDPAPLVSAPAAYQAAQAADGIAPAGPWYAQFNDAQLSDLIAQGFAGNLDIAQAAARLEQARASADASFSQLFPQIDGAAQASKRREDGETGDTLSEIGAQLSWEVDLFGRLQAAKMADDYAALAAADDVQAVALLLSAEIAENYFSALARQESLALLRDQEDIDGQLLRLIDLRFDSGIGTEVEVLQQQSQLTDTQSRVPVLEGDLRSYENRLDVLIGQAPDSVNRTADNKLVLNGDITAVGVPSDLLLNRPDLRAAKNRLIAADAGIAQALAERLPQITLSGSYVVAAGGAVTGPIASVLAGLVQPLLDWGQRRAEVERNEALYTEQLAAFTQLYLEALEEVETTLYREDRQREFIRRLEQRRTILEQTVSKTRAVYEQGLSDYLPVLSAIQPLRQVERDLVNEKLNLILLRIQLHRALGGAIAEGEAA